MDSPSNFNSHLKEGESILWEGAPKGGFQLRDADVILIPMSIIMLGFALILNYILLNYESPFVFKVFGIFLAVFGIYLAGIRFFMSAGKRKRTFYCITNKRVLVISGRKKKLKTLPLKNINRIDNTEEKDGSGFIIFGNVNPLWPWLLGGFYMTSENIPGLEMLSDVKLVLAILQKQVKTEIPDTLATEIRSMNKDDLN